MEKQTMVEEKNDGEYFAYAAELARLTWHQMLAEDDSQRYRKWS